MEMVFAFIVWLSVVLLITRSNPKAGREKGNNRIWRDRKSHLHVDSITGSGAIPNDIFFRSRLSNIYPE
jgi:hypothetical protein